MLKYYSMSGISIQCGTENLDLESMVKKVETNFKLLAEILIPYM
jgi:hypothetical protein